MFCALVFSMPFETVDLGFGQGVFSLTRLIGYIFFLAVMLQPGLCFARPNKAFQCFAIYLVVFTLAGVLQDPAYLGDMFVRLTSLIQMLVFFWIASNLMEDERLIRDGMLMTAASCALLSIFQLTGITSHVIESDLGDRIAALGDNLNTTAQMLTIGLIALLGIAVKRAATVRMGWRIAVPLLGAIAVAIVQTGSRGALLALGVGIVAFALNSGSFKVKIRSVITVAVVIGVIVGVTFSFETSRERWQYTLREGSLAQREKIAPAAWEMFQEEPIFGWGPEHNVRELGARLGRRRKDTHNQYLWVLTETGLLGAVPFFLGMGYCLSSAWKARRSPQGVLPIALVLALFVIDMSDTTHNRKYFWFILAYAAASGSYVVAAKPGRQSAGFMPPPGRLPRKEPVSGYREGRTGDLP
jgi:O-antigen ligase